MDIKLQQTFLEKLTKEAIPVAIYLVNGIKLQGKITAYDDTTLLLFNSSGQIVFKRAISTIVPTENVEFAE